MPNYQYLWWGGREPKIMECQIVAMRGRNPDNPSDRTTGSPTEQRLEPNSEGICNCLTTVQKDNLVMEVNYVGNVNPSGHGINGDVVAAEGLARTITTNKGERQKICIKQATKQGYIECEVGGVADLSFPDSQTRRGRVVESGNVCPTIQTENEICRIESKYRIRKLTPRECFRLMDFDDIDFDAAAEVNTNTQLYKQAGNSIVVAVLENIFKEML